MAEVTKKKSWKKSTLLIWILAIAFAWFVVQNGDQDISKAKPYSIIGKDDISTPSRKRISVHIITKENNLTFEEKAQTVMKAAMNIQQDTEAKIVTVFLEISKESSGEGRILASAKYSPDNGGYSGDQGFTWEVRSSRKNPTAVQIKCLELWIKNRKDFQKDDGMTDEPRLVDYIADKLNISPEKVGIPTPLLDNYFHQ